MKHRPALVWLISSYCISSGLWSMLVYYQVATGLQPLPASKLIYFDNYSGIDYWLLASVSALNVAGGVLLLLLRKECVYLFALKFAWAVTLAIWNALTKGSMDTSQPEYIAVGLLLWGGAAAIWFYAWWLMRRGVLR